MNNFISMYSRSDYKRLEPFDCEKSELEVFHCKNCNFKTVIFLFLWSHIEERHAWDLGSDKQIDTYKLKTYTCRNCPYLTYSALQWFRHIVDNCSDQCPYKAKKGPKALTLYTKRFKCKLCCYNTNSAKYLYYHKLRKHTAEEKISWFRCGKCPYKSVRSSDLQHHSVKHKLCINMGWLQCDECYCKFRRKGNLQRHISTKHAS